MSATATTTAAAANTTANTTAKAAAERARKELGRRGEQLAAAYLEQQGLVILSRNWRCRGGELDIVATDRVRLVVCEVKTRRGVSHGDPAEAVSHAKIAKIRELTNVWLSRHQVAWCDIRFDVIAVLWPANGAPRLRHLRGAF
jgi:putative endonuclease